MVRLLIAAADTRPWRALPRPRPTEPSAAGDAGPTPRLACPPALQRKGRRCQTGYWRHDGSFGIHLDSAASLFRKPGPAQTSLGPWTLVLRFFDLRQQIVPEVVPRGHADHEDSVFGSDSALDQTQDLLGTVLGVVEDPSRLEHLLRYFTCCFRPPKPSWGVLEPRCKRSRSLATFIVMTGERWRSRDLSAD